MPSRDPITLRLTARALARADGVFHLLKHRVGKVRPELMAAFELVADERPFARALLAKRPETWLFRSNQRAFAGDFIAIDMSCLDPGKRRALALDLKLGAPVREGAAGNAFVRVGAAVDEIAQQTAAINTNHTIACWSGDATKILQTLFS
ncbi:MAG: hypothetical protein K8H88_24180 [Sandaracinaceae bacterium]|nr:hypothetical protein [Sandaracinaceae bacterium]